MKRFLCHPIPLGFFSTLLISRTFFYLIHLGYFPLFYWSPYRGIHIHHFSYGIVLFAIGGYLSLKYQGRIAKYALSIVYGCALFLVADQFSMWFRLREENPDPLRNTGILFVIFCFIVVSIVKRTAPYFFRKTRQVDPDSVV